MSQLIPPSGEAQGEDRFQCKAGVLRGNSETESDPGGEGHDSEPNAHRCKYSRFLRSVAAHDHLHQAKKFVESVPKVLKEGMPKEEAEKLLAKFKELGAVVVLE